MSILLAEPAQAGEMKTIRGKLYVMTNGVSALLRRYAKDLPVTR